MLLNGLTFGDTAPVTRISAFAGSAENPFCVATTVQFPIETFTDAVDTAFENTFIVTTPKIFNACGAANITRGTDLLIVLKGM
jgi:hypothetical protein